MRTRKITSPLAPLLYKERGTRKITSPLAPLLYKERGTRKKDIAPPLLCKERGLGGEVIS